MDARRTEFILSVLLLSTLLLSSTVARTEGRVSPSREDEQLRDAVREVYKTALYDLQACAGEDRHAFCCPAAMNLITAETGLKHCELYARFLFTRGLIFLCEKRTIEQNCPRLLVKQHLRTDIKRLKY
ncbi:hypothetical protein MPTK1_2g14580 [Marchantia polymorpha subsp. ruderalis]|uniref:Bifunctional inhibitor/plant lipid transfer protein/seed storage helical domain-containing protein n=1 Tax=Marchantia polymorpha TaxID=3197 RepID=A0A2R6X1R4_MARPO|nr:hypothetical protein MARPO_0042s0080 [Marchantia polymorpha]BBN02349.1 hypothetical protein Mp_2g14580 [Marchantia polymorpha subsp. ruderalis]|eukprot:PTQ40044.1 hypothetical protein MARPO_0042s0080 [Marchantia polymorpha]